MTRTRTSASDMLALAVADLAAAAGAVGVGVSTVGDRSLTLTFDDSDLELDVVPAAYATGPRVDEIVHGAASRNAVLVADRITSEAREKLNAAGWGWLDRRGHLRLRAHGVLIDTAVEPSAGDGAPPTEPIRGRAGLAVAYRLLTNPTEPISPTRSSLSFAPSTISEAVSRLRDTSLLEEDGTPLLPELFWVLADHWRTDRVWLAKEPPAEEANGHDLESSGWCVSGTVAAAEWGAPVVSLVGAPPDLYVPGPAALNIAARRYGTAQDPHTAAASIAVAPVSDVTAHREPPRSQPWPLAHPVAVALDLAQDRARGREILEDWSPPERVW
jgi:hypothetical protein